MNPYIQIVNKKGCVTYMHEENGDIRQTRCEVMISGEKPNEFSTTVTDRDGNEKEFVFEPADVGRIIARTISPETVVFVEEMFGDNELYELIECKELFYGEEGLDESDIGVFLNMGFGSDQEFFFRLKEKDNGDWTLCFVFNDEEVASAPSEWKEFSQ